MAEAHPNISPKLREWIEAQHMFFVASAPLNGDGHVNLSPKGMDCLRVLDELTVAYLDLTGSGNETSAHMLETGNARITMMWCAFEGAPRILRLYGKGRVVLPEHDAWDDLAQHFTMMPGVRQIVVNHVNYVQTSCGFAVPFFDYVGERDALKKYWIQKGDNLENYQATKNACSLDDLPTHVGQRQPTTDS